MVATPQEKVNSILDFSRSEIVSCGFFLGRESEFTLGELKYLHLSESVSMATFFLFESGHRNKPHKVD